MKSLYLPFSLVDGTHHAGSRRADGELLSRVDRGSHSPIDPVAPEDLHEAVRGILREWRMTAEFIEPAMPKLDHVGQAAGIPAPAVSRQHYGADDEELRQRGAMSKPARA
jgi:hypothetical protein